MKKNLSHNKYESGQAIFVIALIMVGLIGALGLAIDGGGMAFMYRDAQNAADAAALAAAYAACAGGDTASITNAAVEAASDNGFTAGGTTTVSLSRDGANPNLLTVNVGAVKPAYFIQLVYPNGLNVNAKATAQCTPGSTAAAGAGYALVGIGPTSGVAATCHPGCQAVESDNLNVVGNVEVGNYEMPDWTNTPVTGTTRSTNAPVNPLRDLTLAQFRSGGSVYESLPSTHRREISGNWTPTNTDLNTLQGLIYVNGNVNLDARNRALQPFTIVATGYIRITNATQGLNAYTNDLLAFSTKDLGANTCDSSTVVYVSGGGNSRGILYGPNGQVEIVYSGTATWTGALIGRWVDWWNSTDSVQTLQSLPSTVPPIVAMVS